MCQHVGRLLSTEFLDFLFGESGTTGRPDSAVVSQYLVALGAAFRCSGDGQRGCGVAAEQICSCGNTNSLGHGGDGSEVWQRGVSVLEREVGKTVAGAYAELGCRLGANHCTVDSTSRCDICQSWAGRHVCRVGGCARTIVDGGCADGPSASQDLSSGRVLDALPDGRMVRDSPSHGVDERCYDAPGVVLSCGVAAGVSEECREASVGECVDGSADFVCAKECLGSDGGSAGVQEVILSTDVRCVNNSCNEVVTGSSVVAEESQVSEKTRLNRAKRARARDRKRRKQANQRVSSELPTEKMSWRQSGIPRKKKNPELSVSVSAVDAAKESLARVWLLRNKREEAKLLREEIAGGDESGAHVARLAALDREEQAAAIERRIVENQVKKAKADHELKVLQARNLVISVEKDRVAQLAAVERGRVSVEKAHATLKSSGSSSFAETLLSGSSGSVSPNSSISQQELLNLEKSKLDLERENEENKDVIKDLVALVRSTDGAEVADRVKVYMKKKEKALSWLTLDEHGSVDQGEIDKRFPSGWDAVVHEDIGKVHIESAYGVTQLSGGKYERVAYGAPEIGLGKEDDDVSDVSALTGDNLVKRLRDLELMLAR